MRASKTPLFGTIDQVLANLVSWVGGKSLSETKTFDVEGEDTLPVYCFDIRKAKNAGHYLLTTWNEVPMIDGGVPTANGSAKVGKVDVKLADVANGNIPGYPSYFYFMPKENLVFSLRPDYLPHNGHRGLNLFLKGFLEKATEFVVYDKNSLDGNPAILGYRKSDNSEIMDLSPGYASSPLRLPGEIQYLEQNIQKIRKLVRRDSLSYALRADRELIVKLLENVGLIGSEQTIQSTTFNYEIDFQPSIEDFNAIVESNNNNLNEKSEIGFRLSGESNVIHWLSHSLAKDDMELDVVVKKNGILLQDELLVGLHKSGVDRLREIAGVTK